MAKILIGINTLTTVDQMAYSNHMQMFFRLGRNTQHQLILSNPRRMSIDRMRNTCGRIVAENEDIDYLAFIDDDVLVPFDCIDKLIATGADIAAGWTLIRGYPFKNMFFKYLPDGNLTHYKEPVLNDQGLIECDAVGFSCVVIKGDLLRKTPSPWFVTGGYNTEDIYFCIKAKLNNPDIKIVVNPEVKTAHILGPETIHPDNREPFIEYMQKTRSFECLDEVKNPKDAEFPMNEAPTEGQISYENVLKADLKLPD